MAADVRLRPKGKRSKKGLPLPKKSGASEPTACDDAQRTVRPRQLHISQKMRVYWGKDGIAADPELSAFLALEDCGTTSNGKPNETKGLLGVRPSQEVSVVGYGFKPTVTQFTVVGPTAQTPPAKRLSKQKKKHHGRNGHVSMVPVPAFRVVQGLRKKAIAADATGKQAYIRYLMPTPDDLDTTLDYDVSSEDESVIKTLRQGRRCVRCTVHGGPVELVEYLISRFERAHHAIVARSPELLPAFQGAEDARPPLPDHLYPLEEARKDNPEVPGEALEPVYHHWVKKRRRSIRPLLQTLWCEHPWVALGASAKGDADGQEPGPEDADGVPFLGTDLPARLPARSRVMTWEEAADHFLQIRSDMERMRTLADQVRKREKDGTRSMRALLAQWREALASPSAAAAALPNSHRLCFLQGEPSRRGGSPRPQSQGSLRAGRGPHAADRAWIVKASQRVVEHAARLNGARISESLRPSTSPGACRSEGDEPCSPPTVPDSPCSGAVCQLPFAARQAPARDSGPPAVLKPEPSSRPGGTLHFDPLVGAPQATRGRPKVNLASCGTRPADLGEPAREPARAGGEGPSTGVSARDARARNRARDIPRRSPAHEELVGTSAEDAAGEGSSRDGRARKRARNAPSTQFESKVKDPAQAGAVVCSSGNCKGGGAADAQPRGRTPEPPFGRADNASEGPADAIARDLRAMKRARREGIPVDKWKMSKIDREHSLSMCDPPLRNGGHGVQDPPPAAEEQTGRNGSDVVLPRRVGILDGPTKILGNVFMGISLLGARVLLGPQHPSVEAHAALPSATQPTDDGARPPTARASRPPKQRAGSRNGAITRRLSPLEESVLRSPILASGGGSAPMGGASNAASRLPRNGMRSPHPVGPPPLSPSGPPGPLFPWQWWGGGADTSKRVRTRAAADPSAPDADGSVQLQVRTVAGLSGPGLGLRRGASPRRLRARGLPAESLQRRPGDHATERDQQRLPLSSPKTGLGSRAERALRADRDAGPGTAVTRKGAGRFPPQTGPDRRATDADAKGSRCATRAASSRSQAAADSSPLVNPTFGLGRSRPGSTWRGSEFPDALPAEVLPPSGGGRQTLGGPREAAVPPQTMTQAVRSPAGGPGGGRVTRGRTAGGAPAQELHLERGQAAVPLRPGPQGTQPLAVHPAGVGAETTGRPASPPRRLTRGHGAAALPGPEPGRRGSKGASAALSMGVGLSAAPSQPVARAPQREPASPQVGPAGGLIGAPPGASSIGKGPLGRVGGPERERRMTRGQAAAPGLSAGLPIREDKAEGPASRDAVGAVRPTRGPETLREALSGVGAKIRAHGAVQPQTLPAAAAKTRSHDTIRETLSEVKAKKRGRATGSTADEQGALLPLTKATICNGGPDLRPQKRAKISDEGGRAGAVGMKHRKGHGPGDREVHLRMAAVFRIPENFPL
eukprot:jgi/Botrbrau1/9856/Bobra.0313s0025.1